MRKVYLLLCCFAALLFINKASAQEKFTWKEMASFHSTAMLAFHGAEDGKLQPARDSAAAMVQKVTAWRAASVPAGNDAVAIKSLLQKLADECAAISTAVQAKKPDAELKPLVLKAHHIFHEVIEKVK